MRKQLLALLVLAGVCLSASAAQTYTVDPAHSFANFTIGHMGLSTMHGRIDVTGGTIVMDRDGGKSKVNVTLDPASVDTGDRARDAHLLEQKGFFQVDQYPHMRFSSSRVMFHGQHQAKVAGKLTLHGVTRPVTLAVHDINCKINPLEDSKYTCGFAADTQLKRSDFGMDAFAKIIADTVDITIEVEANRPADRS